MLSLAFSLIILTPEFLSWQCSTSTQEWTSPPNRNWHWRPIRVPLSDLRKRLTFPAQVPLTLSGGYRIATVEVLWGQKVQYRDAPFIIPAQQYVHLRYESSADVLDVIEARHFKPAAIAQVEWAYNAECFNIHKKRLSPQANWQWGTSKWTDSLVTSKTRSGDFILKLSNEVAGSAPLAGVRSKRSRT